MKHRYLIYSLCIMMVSMSTTIAQEGATEKPIVVGHAPPEHRTISLPTPQYSKSAAFVGLEGKVSVSVTVDGTGKVIKAKNESGHPFFQADSLKAALEAKFYPLFLSGKPIRFRTVIVYSFVRSGDGERSKTETAEILERFPGSIILTECRGCEDTLESRPTVNYPKLVGFGPPKYEGYSVSRYRSTRQGRLFQRKEFLATRTFAHYLKKRL